MLVGKHGIGKSRILEDYFASRGQKVVTLFLGQMADPGDLIGLPEKNEKTGKTDFMLPYWFPIDNSPIVLFLDELNRARPEVLQTIMDLTLNRKLAGKKLPEGSRIISAVNGGNEYQLTELDPALVSRFNIYEFAPTVSDWIVWAKSQGLDKRIIDFISENPEYLDSPEESGESLERNPDRRSWERASDIIRNFETVGQNEKVLLTGIVGDKATSLFAKFLDSKSLPSAKKILLQNFDDVKAELEKASVPEWTQVNSSLFRFIESQNLNQGEVSIACKNLNSYFDFLESEEKAEVISHFISMCSSRTFPKTLNFISENCFDFYKKLMDFAGKI